jgi:hypothetical protein
LESLASLPENVLAEIFLNLPPHPAHLRSVALGSHQFRDVVTNRPFLRRFRAHHGDVPPLVGFMFNERIPRFLPTASPGISRSGSDRAAAGAHALEESLDDHWHILGTRHGRVLLQSTDKRRLLVLDPMAGHRKYIQAPLEYTPTFQSTAALVCDPGAAGHGDCRSCAFRVVFVNFRGTYRTVINIFSSETNRWVKVDLNRRTQERIDMLRRCVQVGDVIYWQSALKWIICFNVNTHQLLPEIPVPDGTHAGGYAARTNSSVVAPKDGSSLGFVYVSSRHLHLWVSYFVNGVHVEWNPVGAFWLDYLLPAVPDIEEPPHVRIIGYDEDENVVYLWTKVGVFGLQLEAMESYKLLDNCGWLYLVYPYKSFFITAGGNIFSY